MQTNSIRILIVDDHALTREGLAVLLGYAQDIEVISEAKDGIEAVAQFRLHSPDVTLMDIDMPGGDGLEAIKNILAEFPAARIIAMGYLFERQFADAVQAGAITSFAKEDSREHILQTIRSVHACT